MKKSLKVVTIGGGSSYTPELIEGFIKRFENLPVKELWLVDVEAGKEKLDIIIKLAKRMVKKAGVDITIHSTLDRRSALKDADFVTTQFRVGQLDARITDEQIPAKHGILGQETNGPGGLFKGLRTIPVIFDIIKDCEELCPNAWIISFTNPAGMISEAVFRFSDWQRFIGLCNVPIGMIKGVAKTLEIEPERVQIDFAGLNHMVYGLHIYVDGIEITKDFLNTLANSNNAISLKNIIDIPWDRDFLKGLEVLPCPYHRYYYQHDAMLQNALDQYNKGNCRGQVVKKVEATLFEEYKEDSLNVKPEALEKRGGAFYSDAACNLICSIFNNTQDVQPVNTRNSGAIVGFETNEAVEISSVITSHGPRPIAMGKMPDAIDGLLHQIKSFEITAAKAALSGKYEDALVAMTINPFVMSDRIARKLLDEMLLANKQYLPRFHDVIAKLEKEIV